MLFRSLTSAARVFGRVSGPAPAGFALDRCRWPLAGCPVERCEDQSGGLREVDQRREGLREGVQVQRRPGTLLALGLCRGPVQVKTAAKPKPGPRTSRRGLGLREGLREGVRSSAGRVRPGALSLVAGRSPGGSPLRGAGSGSTGRLGLWPVQVKTAAKPTPGPRTSRGGLWLREGVPIQRRPGTLLAMGLCRGPLAGHQVEALCVERDQPGGSGSGRSR